MKPEGNYKVELENGRMLHEAETTIYFSREKAGQAVISSYDPSIIKRLLNSNFFSIGNINSFKQNGTTIITYVDGEVPIGSINIGKPRASGSTAQVVKALPYVYTEEEIAKNKKMMEYRLHGEEVVKPK